MASRWELQDIYLVAHYEMWKHHKTFVLFCRNWQYEPKKR